MVEREDEDANNGDEYLYELDADGEEYDEPCQTYMVRRLMLSPKVKDGTH